MAEAGEAAPMAYDENLARALRAAASAALDGAGGLEEKRMFGGTCLMFRGNMLAGVMGPSMGGGMMFRVGPDREAEALALPGVLPMKMATRQMSGCVALPPGPGLTPGLTAWLMDLALENCCAMPAK